MVDVRRSSAPFGEFATAWLATRRRGDGRPLTPATQALYGDLLRRVILPTFEQAKLASIQPAQVRAWHAGVAGNVSPLQAEPAAFDTETARPYGWAVTTTLRPVTATAHSGTDGEHRRARLLQPVGYASGCVRAPKFCRSVIVTASPSAMSQRRARLADR